MTNSSREGPVVSFRDVGKVYDDEGLRVTAIKSVTFDIPRRRFAMIVGPSGSGKTTLLNLVGCIDTPTSGKLEVCGQDIASLADRELTDFRSRNIAFVFQNFNLLPVLPLTKTSSTRSCYSACRRASDESKPSRCSSPWDLPTNAIIVLTS